MKLNPPVVIPRQHGAWSVLLVSFVVGSFALGRPGVRSALLLAFLILGFVGQATFGAAIVGANAQDPGAARQMRWAGGLMAAASLLLASLIVNHGLPLLLPLAVLLGAGASAAAVFERKRKAFSALAEVIGTAGLSIVVLMAAYAATGSLTIETLALWAMCLLVFCGSVFHVRFVVRDHAQRQGVFTERLRAGRASMVYHLLALLIVSVLALGLGLLPALAVIALVPMTVKVAFSVLTRASGRVNFKRLGQTELALMVLFALIALHAYRSVAA